MLSGEVVLRNVVASVPLKILLLVSATFGLPAAKVSAEPAKGALFETPLAAKIFGSRETVLQASLSPDSSKLATVEPNGSRGSMLRVLDLTDPAAKPVTVSVASPERIAWCNWTGARRLVCLIYGIVQLTEVGEISYVSRLNAIDFDGQNMQILKAPGQQRTNLSFNLSAGTVIDWNPGKDGHFLLVRSHGVQAGRSSSEAGLAVDDVDSVTMDVKTVDGPRASAVDFLSDGHGNIRLMGTQQEKGIGQFVDYFYRKKNQSEWRPLGTLDTKKNEGFNPFDVDSQQDVVFGLRKVDGRLAAYRVKLDGSGAETKIFAHSDVDVDGFVTIGRNRRVVGVRYTTDREQIEYIDLELKSLAIGLAKALPSLPLIRFVDSSEDESKLLLWAGSDTDPGHFFLLDRKKGGLTELALSRAALDGVQLGKMRSVEIPTPDGKTIPGYLTLPPGSDGKNLPTIVMPHGGPSARDTWGFDWLAQYWASIGYAVLQPNFRGSAGYGDGWFGDNGFKEWQTAIGDVATSGRWLVTQGIANPDKLAVFGWSYGGYAALQVAESEPGLFRAVVAIAPVTDLGRLKEERRNWSDYYAVADFVGRGNVVDSGSPARHADKMTVPVLLFHGKLDRNVSYKQSELMNQRLKAAGKQSTFVSYAALDHQLDDSDARQDMLVKSAEFLKAALTEAP